MDDLQPPQRRKFLIIRFSSIGDIVLTTPVIRALKQQIPEAEIHFLTKKENGTILQENPYISEIHLYNGHLETNIDQLKLEGFEFVIDLQKNRRSKKVVKSLQRPSASFDKLNCKKWLYVNLKLNYLPGQHVVDRYFEAVEPLKVLNDGQGLDYFIPENEEYDKEDLPAVFEDGYVAVAVGSIHYTKRIPVEKIVEIGRILHKPVMLLGGRSDVSVGEEIVSRLGERAYNGCGKYSLNQSASIIRQSDCMLTGDTGLMHIAAAFKKPVASLWGNTVPEFGMYPYMPQNPELWRIFEVCNLSCRPCSKLGYKKCPRKHFNCMNTISAVEVAEWINKF